MLGGARALDEIMLVELLLADAFADHPRCDLRGWSLGVGAVDALLRSRDLGGLRSLGLPCHLVGDASLEHLAASEALEHLEHLAITGVIGEYDERDRWCSDRGFRALCRAPRLAGLRELEFGFGDRVSKIGAAALREAPWLDQLTRLSLSCTLDVAALREVLAAGRLARLEQLRLSRANDEVAELVLDAELPALRHAELRGGLSDTMEARLREAMGTKVDVVPATMRWTATLHIA